MPIAFSRARDVPGDVPVLGVPVFAERRLPARQVVELDLDYLAERGFEGKVGETAAVPADDGGTVVVVGMGDEKDMTAETVRQVAAAFVRAAWQDTRAAVAILDAVPASVDRAAAAQALVEGAALAAYQFTKYKTESKPCRLESIAVVSTTAAAQAGIDRGVCLAEAVALARDMVNEPAGTMTPTRLADIATDVAQRHGLGLTVFDEVAIRNEGFGGLEGVSRGSAEPPRLVELVYEPSAPRATVAIVGKGITFDSGGLSLKPADGMETMKTDMSGAAAVLATMSAVAQVGARVIVVGIIPCAENMPGGRAIKPGDVLKIRNGKTVEVLNTDAEGRLVLADGLSLAVERGVDAVIDLATLTGACMVALGRKYSGLMGNADGLIAQVEAAAARAGEHVWHLPLPDDYRKLIDSEIADIRNTGGDRYGGALTAGLFLKEFVDDVPWVHLDIAGPARAEQDEGYTPRGGTGVGVRTLVELLTHFEKRALATVKPTTTRAR